MINIIFIHGISSQPSGYSNILFDNIIQSYQKSLINKGIHKKQVLTKKINFFQKEISWNYHTSDLINRYKTIQYDLVPRHGKWNFLTKIVDPLVIQILFYLKDKDHQKKSLRILKGFHQDFQKACKNKPNKIIVIGHSLGSVLAFDYLFGFRKYKLSSSHKVQAFFSIGSPIPIFTTAMGHVESNLTMPKSIKNWINLLDPDDGIARYCQGHMPNLLVKDVEVNTGWDPINSHTNYWGSKKVASIIADYLIHWGL